MRYSGMGFWAVLLAVFIIYNFQFARAAEKTSGGKSNKSAAKEIALKDSLRSDDNLYYKRFVTKHGVMKLVDKHGKIYDYPTEIKLNSVTLLESQKNMDGQQQRFMVDLFKLPYQESPGYKGGEPVKIDRILLSEGIIMDDITQFILLDFTCPKPFVSERFGFNPDLEGQLTLEEVEWGKDKSYIYINGDDQRFIYYTCDRVDMDYDYDGKRVVKKTPKSKKTKKSK